MGAMMEVHKALSRWQAAQRAWARSELAFSESVFLYLARRGPPPRAAEVGEIAAARLRAEESFDSLCVALRQVRQAVPLL